MRRGLVVISDDVYERLTYDGFVQHHLVAVLPELRPQAVVVSSCSKTYAMTGWRLGYAAGPAHVIAAMATLQGQSTSNPSSISQAAAVEALAGPQDCVDEMVFEFGRRRAYVLERLSAIANVTVAVPRGAFYVLPNVASVLGGCVAVGRRGCRHTVVRISGPRSVIAIECSKCAASEPSTVETVQSSSRMWAR